MMTRSVVLCGPLLVALACSGQRASVEGVPQLSEHTLRGEPAPEFDLPLVHGGAAGERATLATYSGRVLLLDFWATWCEPCKKSFPYHQALADRHAGRVAVLGVSEDDEEVDFAEFAHETGVSFPLVWDQNKSLAPRYRLTGMPTLFIIDPQGVIRFVKAGYVAGDERDIARAVESLLTAP